MINGLSDVPMIHFLCYRQLEMNVKMLFYIRLNRNGVTEYGCFYICFYFGEGVHVKISVQDGAAFY